MAVLGVAEDDAVGVVVLLEQRGERPAAGQQFGHRTAMSSRRAVVPAGRAGVGPSPSRHGWSGRPAANPARGAACPRLPCVRHPCVRHPAYGTLRTAPLRAVPGRAVPCVRCPGVRCACVRCPGVRCACVRCPGVRCACVRCRASGALCAVPCARAPLRAVPCARAPCVRRPLSRVPAWRRSAVFSAHLFADGSLYGSGPLRCAATSARRSRVRRRSEGGRRSRKRRWSAGGRRSHERRQSPPCAVILGLGAPARRQWRLAWWLAEVFRGH